MIPPTAPPGSSAGSPLARSLAVATLALAGLAFHLSPWSARASLVVLDASFGILRAIAPKTAPDDILVVGLESAAASIEVDPVGPTLRKLPDVLVRIARGNPRAVALDVTLPRASLDASLPGYDDMLATALAVTQAAAPLVVGLSVDARPEVVPIHDRLLRGVDPRALAFTLLPRDEDGVVRQVVLGLPTQQGHWPTLSGWLCEVLSGRCGTGLIDYALGGGYEHVPQRRLLEIRDDAALERLFRDRVVFVAAVTGPQDRVPLPVSFAGWESSAGDLPAVLGHAQTLRTLLHGTPVREAPLPVLIVVIALAALLAKVAGPAALPAAALAFAGALVGAVLALRLGYYVPLAAPLATLALALVVSRRLG